MTPARSVTADGNYRFRLERAIGTPNIDPPPQYRICLLIVIDHPRSHDGEDATLRRGIELAERWGYPRLLMAAANPTIWCASSMPSVPPEEILVQNDLHLRAMARDSSRVVVAWGRRVLPELAHRALAALRSVGATYALSFSRDHKPRHLLYMRGGAEPQPWDIP